ncbi:unnamed protein product [Symbiodinium sp. KB8]|nr:unnamed protein product [Symbiodinium sp. KB8]
MAAAPDVGETKKAPLLSEGTEWDPELTRSPFTGDGRPSEPERIQITIHGPSASAANLAPSSQSLVGSGADAPPGSDEGPLTGLTSDEAAARLGQFGRNEIPEHVEPWYVMLGKQFVGMMPFMLIVAAALSAITEDWADFAVIALMLVVNAFIGFHEEFKARQSLDALKAQMTATVPVKRDGNMIIVPVADLVPGDVIFLRGGNIVPADCEFLEGDEMLVDTAALTGEPIPRKIPRPDREGEATGSGKLLLSGCIVKQGEAHCEVRETGLNTEIGQAAGLVAEASGHQPGIFETKIMQVVHAVILLALVDAGVVLYVDVAHRGTPFSKALLNVLALVIGAVPIALPLVMQVTMAIGAASMAGKKAIVTHLTALQEIASMTVLCSDKTGTLTTADMRVLPHRTWTRNRLPKDDALLYACLASNPANKEDPIDKAVLGSGSEHFGVDEAEQLMARYKKTKFVGFNPTVKRTVVYCEHEEKGKLKISKGLVDKVLITGEDGGDCWECEDAMVLKDELKEVDLRLSSQGYKTVGLAVSEGEGPMQFVAIIPMLDPPRQDTQVTIFRIRSAGINVKMITGDHLNIAVETSRLIGLGTGILPASDLWPASATRDETIMTADGFAQVLPKDKREVILVLQNRGLVVGMTGDGVNDAPALAQAQIGIAVDGATEAARSAADIILTSPGLSAIFDAVVESRKIFARLRSYVLYRIAATIQIVLVLSVLIYAYNDTMPAIYVILLALVNDVTMLPVASDNASPSALPEIPSMPSILLASFLYGILGTAQTMALYMSDLLEGDGSDEYRMAVTYLQMSIAVELFIFSCRTPVYVFNLFRSDALPSVLLLVCVMGGNILVSLLAGFGDTFKIVHKVAWVDIGWIWLYDLLGLLVIDFLKRFFNIVGLDWMSAGAGGDVLGYPNLPDEFHHASHRSTLLHHRSSVRSVLYHSRLSTISQAKKSTSAPSLVLATVFTMKTSLSKLCWCVDAVESVSKDKGANAVANGVFSGLRTLKSYMTGQPDAEVPVFLEDLLRAALALYVRFGSQAQQLRSDPHEPNGVSRKVEELLCKPFDEALKHCPALAEYIQKNSSKEDSGTLEKEFREHWHREAPQELRQVLEEIVDPEAVIGFADLYGHLKVGPLAGFCADDGFRVCAELNAELMRPVGAVAAAGCKWAMVREEHDRIKECRAEFEEDYEAGPGQPGRRDIETAPGIPLDVQHEEQLDTRIFATLGH